MKNRLQSLDVLRGIAIVAMIIFNNASHKFIPLSHVQWNGLHPADLAYPFFMFIMGVAVSLSLKKYVSDQTGPALVRIIRRTVTVFLLGVALNCFGPLVNGKFSFETIRIFGVLQRLALAYFVGSIIYLFTPKKAHLPIAGSLLVAYVVILKCFNGYVCSPENILAKIDYLVVGPAHLYMTNLDGVKFPFEPESLLGTISSAAHVLIGSYIGDILLKEEGNKERVRRIALAGTVMLFIGFLFQYLDPINKKLWTSTFVLVTCGSASLLLALLIDIIDIRGKEKWSGVFKVFGTNALLAYAGSQVISNLLGVLGVRNFIVLTVFTPVVGENAAPLFYAFVLIAVIGLLLLPLYKRKIFVRL